MPKYDNKTQALIQDLFAQADENSWNYAMESYSKGSKLCMLVLDTRPLWKWGGAAIPTLAWMAEEHGSLFDSYWAYFRDPMLYFRRFFDNRALEQCYLLSMYFDVTWYMVGTDGKIMLHPIPKFDRSLFFDDYLSLYRHYMEEHGIKCDTAAILPTHHKLDQPPFIREFRKHMPRKYYTPEIASPKEVEYPLEAGGDRDVFAHPLQRGFGKTQFYLWPDIYFRKALGFTDDIEPEQLKEFGINEVLCVLCDADKFREAGFKVEVIDEDQPDDSEWTVTKRCFDRWPNEAKGICYGMWQADKTHPGWLGYMIRNRYFGLYDSRWRTHLPKAVEVAHELGNRNIMGTGDDWNHNPWIFLLPDTQAGWLFQPTEAGTPSIKRGMRLKCPKPSILPWDVEVSDRFLYECAERNKIGICVVCIVTDLGYVSMYPSLMDIFVNYEAKAGFAYCLPWAEYYPEWLQKMYSETYAPYVEPLLGEVGPSWYFTMKHAGTPPMHPGAFKKQLLFTLSKIAELMGEDYIPRGFASGYRDLWEDTEPYIDLLAECGFKYYFAGRSPRIQFEARNGIVAMSTLYDHMAGAFNIVGVDHPLEGVMNLEKELEGPGFCAVTPDSGMYYSYTHRSHVLDYVATGGDTKRLFPLKPSEIIRYATILQEIRTDNKK